MIKEIKQISRYKRKNYRNVQYDDNDRVIIDLTIKDDSNFLSPYSSSTYSDISSDLSEFITHSLYSINIDEDLHFNIYTNEIDSNTKELYKNAIINHFKDKNIDLYIDIKRLTKISIIMALIGIMALSLMIIFNINNIGNEITSEIINIFAWVFIWEAVDIYFLQRTVIKLKMRKYQKIINSTIEFKEIKK